MKKVCLFNFNPIEKFHGYTIETFDPLSYFSKNSKWPLNNLIRWGLNGYDKKRALIAGAFGLDRLYRERDPDYMRMTADFIDRFRDFDIVVMATYNFIHPEILSREMKKPIKILGFIDDPISTYRIGIPYLWAFDGAFYISPSQIDNMFTKDTLRRWGCKNSTWWPLVPYAFDKPEDTGEKFFKNRDIDLVYVGNPSAGKMEQLIKLKKYFGSRMHVHGRWALKGYIGLVRGILGKSVYPYRVKSLTTEARTDLYHRTKIGFNMHVSDYPIETGNMRMYETPAHGMMMVCDKAGANVHESIFKPEREAVYYDNIDHAVELIEYYLKNEKERVQIARAGYGRYWQDYEWESNLLRFLNWASSIKK